MIFSVMADASKNKFSYMADMLIMLVPCAAISVFYNGFAALRLIIGGVLCAVICDFLGTMLLTRENTLKDLSAVVTGLCTSLVLPSTAPLWLSFAAAAAAVIIGKLPFGKFDRSPFVPAAVGIAFISVCYPSLLFNYQISGNAAATVQSSLTYMLTQGNSINMTTPGILNVLVGNCPGPIGTTCTVLLFACLIYLLIRRINSFISASGFVAVCALFAVLFPRVLSGRQASVIMELSGGMLFFGAIFFITYPNIKFRSPVHALLYGISGGAVCMLIRYFGAYEEGMCFAVLLLNTLAYLFEEKKKPEAAEEAALSQNLSQDGALLNSSAGGGNSDG